MVPAQALAIMGTVVARMAVVPRDIAQPSAIGLAPVDKFVYISIVPKEVAGFTFDPSTGALTPITGSPFSVGQVTRDLVIMPHAVQ